MSRTRIDGIGCAGGSAEQDEDRGFNCTAAFEWRTAADLLAPIPALADQCWRQWERLMQLPRSLVLPIDSTDSSQPQPSAALAQAA